MGFPLMKITVLILVDSNAIDQKNRVVALEVCPPCLVPFWGAPQLSHRREDQGGLYRGRDQKPFLGSP